MTPLGLLRDELNGAMELEHRAHERPLLLAALFAGAA